LSCIDLFAGAGGFAVGFRAADWRMLGANDIDEAAGETFRLNFPETHFFQGSIAALSVEHLLETCGLKPGELDCLIGGPPCQSFSYNNHKRSADDERAGLFRDYLRIVEGLKPKTIVMENVPGILTIGGGAVIEEIKTRLSSLNYTVDATTLFAEQYGVPQARRRVFIVASRVGEASEMLPSPTHWLARLCVKRSGKPLDRPEGDLLRIPTVWQAIGDLPEIENGGGKHVSTYAGKQATTEYQRRMRAGSKKLHNHVCSNLGSINIERMSHIPEGGNWRDIPRSLLPAGMQRAELTDHTKRYGRLDRKGLASTLLTKCDPHWGAYIHPTQDRTISVREAARLQGFPDTFHFAGHQIGYHFEQIGNAVPVPLANAIADCVAAHIRAAEASERQAA
jgi:DNA (cytosine-5)-methyltransferase 1